MVFFLNSLFHLSCNVCRHCMCVCLSVCLSVCVCTHMGACVCGLLLMGFCFHCCLHVTVCVSMHYYNYIYFVRYIAESTFLLRL